MGRRYDSNQKICQKVCIDKKKVFRPESIKCTNPPQPPRRTLVTDLRKYLRNGALPKEIASKLTAEMKASRNRVGKGRNCTKSLKKRFCKTVWRPVKEIREDGLSGKAEVFLYFGQWCKGT